MLFKRRMRNVGMTGSYGENHLIVRCSASDCVETVEIVETVRNMSLLSEQIHICSVNVDIW